MFFQGAHIEGKKNPRKLFTNAEEILFVLFRFFFRSTESAVSEHYHRSGVVAVHFAAYVVNPVLAVYARLIVLWSHSIIVCYNRFLSRCPLSCSLGRPFRAKSVQCTHTL